MAGSTGPLTYVYVSYTQILFWWPIILGPSLGLVYTLFIVFILSLYMYLISQGIIEELSMDDVPYGSEMEFLAAIACFSSQDLQYTILFLKWRTYIVVL